MILHDLYAKKNFTHTEGSSSHSLSMPTDVVTFQLHQYAGAALFSDTALNLVSLAGSRFWIGGAPEHVPKSNQGMQGELRSHPQVAHQCGAQNVLLLLDASCNLSLVSASQGYPLVPSQIVPILSQH